MTLPRVKVLLVEDNPTDVRLIQESLSEASDASFDLETADTLAAGLQRLGAGDMDALLLDLALPDSFGQETFVRAKAQAMGAAIIILTGMKDDSLALKLVQGGAQDFVAKVDVSGNNLTRAILYAIERERLEQEYRKLNEQLERRVRERTAELEASNKQLEAFSYSVSHDLRAPLALMSGFAELVVEKYGEKLDEQGRRLLRKIQDSTLKMSDLIEDLIRLAKVSRQGLSLTLVSLDSLVSDVLKDLQEENGKRRIEWLVRPLPSVHCDYGLMKQVFANLLANAVKYTRWREHAAIEIGEKLIAGESVIFVRDNGVGFDMNKAGGLFAPFQRLHSDSEFEGTGIGLATVHRIIEKHKGRIWVEAERDRGATFYLTLFSQDTEGIAAPDAETAAAALLAAESAVAEAIEHAAPAAKGRKQSHSGA